MKSNYKRLGNCIKEVKVRNAELKVQKLLGINIDKFFMPSVANIVGTDLSVYKIVKKHQFACNRMHVGRDYRLPISMSESDEEFMVSPAYDVFEIVDTNILDPEFLMMWFSRSEFDRNAWFCTDADVRGGLHWKAFCDMQLPVPLVDKQKEVVKEYKVIQNRIYINQQLIQKLEETAQTLYSRWFDDFEFPDENGQAYRSSGGKMEFDKELGKEIPAGWKNVSLSDIVNVKDGTHDSPLFVEVGFPFVTSTHLNLYDISLDTTQCISEEDYNQINKRSKVDKHDILFSMIGTVGLVNYVLYDKVGFAIKNVGLIKTSEKREFAEYVLFYLKSDAMKSFLASNPNGSTQNYLTLGLLRAVPLLLPSESVISKFQRFSQEFVKAIHLKVSENNCLKEMEKTLLSKLATIEN